MEGCAQIFGVGSASEMLYNDNVDLLIGPFCSDGLQKFQKIVAKSEIMQIFQQLQQQRN